jgi:hypothetical protein
MQPGTVAGIESGSVIRVMPEGSLRQTLCWSLTGEISQASDLGDSFSVQLAASLVFEFMD